MIGLLILLIGVGYYYLSKFIIQSTYEKYGTKKAKYIATAIMVLIPTWDIVLGYPIYAFLCLTKAGVHIYKTVDNVEGFYVGEKDAQYEPYEPYKGYKYIEYQEVKHQKPTGKYYRSYWVNFWEDTNASKLCVSPLQDDDSAYTKAVKSGHCIVKEEIAESEVSLLIDIEKKVLHVPILYLDVYRVEFIITDRKTHKPYMQIVDYFVDESWMTGATNIVSGNTSTMNCNSRIINTSEGFEINRKYIIDYLTKGDKQDGND